MNSLAGDPSDQTEVLDSTFSAMNGHGWSSLATNQDSPIEFYFASDARFVLLTLSLRKLKRLDLASSIF